MKASVLFTTVCNDDFANALTLLLWSILHHNPSFDHPFKVYHKGDLSEESQERLGFVYPNITFEAVSDNSYASKIPHYLALETFREEEPDSVVFIDSDIICLGDISYLANLRQPIAASLDYDFKFPFELTFRGLFSRFARLNTGVFALGKEHRNQATYHSLYELLDSFPDDYQKGIPWSDQGIINELFLKKTKHIFPYIYNGRKNLFPNKSFAGGKNPLENVRLLHFGGGFKPFHGGLSKASVNSKHHKYSKLHEIYYQYWDKMLAGLGVDWVLYDESA